MLEKYKQEYLNKGTQFILVDGEGIILDSDQKLFEIIPGEPIYNIHPFFHCIFSFYDTTAMEYTFNCIHLSINGKELIADIELAKKQLASLIIITDLTEHYNTAQAIAQDRNESIINSELIVLKNAELEERERFKNSFIQNFSHELRNPLTGIIGITNVLGNTDLSEEQRRMIDFLKDSNSNLKLMLEDVLSISTIASGRLRIESKTFNLSKLLELLKFTYSTKAKQKDLEFECIVDKRIPEVVEGDRLRLFQILTNLLDNAIKYTLSGSISLEVHLNQRRANKVSLRFSISDTGVGIPDESVGRIFESFTRLEGSKAQEGTGLGLAVVKGLLELMQSKIFVRSNVGKGSVFYFDLLLKYPIRSLSPTPKKSTKWQPKPSAKREIRKHKVLIVEDDIKVQTLLFQTLMTTNSFYVDLVNDGALVMEELINHEYDLILMDVNLPNVSGDHVTRLIRDLPLKKVKNIPIVGLTAYGFEDNIKAYLAAGMNSVLIKPYSDELLIETIFKLLK